MLFLSHALNFFCSSPVGRVPIFKVLFKTLKRRKRNGLCLCLEYFSLVNLLDLFVSCRSVLLSENEEEQVVEQIHPLEREHKCRLCTTPRTCCYFSRPWWDSIRKCYSRTGTNNSRPENGRYSLNKCNGFEESIIVLTRHVVFFNFPSLNCRLKMFLQTSVTALTFTIHVLGAPVDFSFPSFSITAKDWEVFPLFVLFFTTRRQKKKKGNFLFVWQIKVSTDAIARPHAAQWHARGKICLDKTFLF